jgi:hypothetical protein
VIARRETAAARNDHLFYAHLSEDQKPAWILNRRVAHMNRPRREQSTSGLAGEIEYKMLLGEEDRRALKVDEFRFVLKEQAAGLLTFRGA